MSLTPDRKDFVEPDARCARRSSDGRVHGFPSSKAFILRDQNGNEYAYGPTCVLHEVSKDALAGIPDFTSRDVDDLDDNEEGGPTVKGRGGLVVEQDDQKKQLSAAKRYLLLRMEKVGNLPDVHPGVKYLPLNDIYLEYCRSGQLDLDQAEHILAIERFDKTPCRMKTVNLLDVYTAHFKLTKMIRQSANPKSKAFLESIRGNLIKNLTLTQRQVETAGLRLHPSAFQ